MATIISRAGPRISLMPQSHTIAERYGRWRRGNWAAIRMDTGVYHPKLETLWIPIASADVTFDRAKKRFHVHGGPQDPRTAQYFLNRLDPDEFDRLFADLKEI